MAVGTIRTSNSLQASVIAVLVLGKSKVRPLCLHTHTHTHAEKLKAGDEHLDSGSPGLRDALQPCSAGRGRETPAGSDKVKSATRPESDTSRGSKRSPPLPPPTHTNISPYHILAFSCCLCPRDSISVLQRSKVLIPFRCATFWPRHALHLLRNLSAIEYSIFRVVSVSNTSYAMQQMFFPRSWSDIKAWVFPMMPSFQACKSLQVDTSLPNTAFLVQHSTGRLHPCKPFTSDPSLPDAALLTPQSVGVLQVPGPGGLGRKRGRPGHTGGRGGAGGAAAPRAGGQLGRWRWPRLRRRLHRRSPRQATRSVVVLESAPCCVVK